MDRTNNPYHDEKVFWPYHMEKSLTILRGSIPAPSLVEIDPTDAACNQMCPHCCFSSSPYRKMVLLNVEALLRFVAETYECGTYAYELVGGGEPTNHPQIADIVRGINSLGKPSVERPHIGMVTNGVLLHRIFSVAEHLDFVRVSLDTSDPANYSLLHGISLRSNDFFRVVGNVKDMISIIGGARVRIGYLVVPPHNHQRKMVLDAAEFAYNLGVGHIVFRPAFLDYVIEREMWREAAEAVLEAKNKYRNDFVLGGVGGSWEHALGRQDHPGGLCRTRPLVLVVKADGTIPSCFLYRERLAERPVIGHISQGFKTVWF